MTAGVITMPKLCAESWGTQEWTLSIKSPILAKGGDRSGLMTWPVTAARLTLVNARTMDGEAITVLTHRMPALSATQVTWTGGYLTGITDWEWGVANYLAKLCVIMRLL